MSKAVVYVLTATAFLIFLVLSPLNVENPRGRVNRRLGFKISERVPHFDPLVTKIERENEMKKQNNTNINNNNNNTSNNDPPTPSRRGLDSSSTVKEAADTYQYLTSGGKLNTTLRLIILFPLLDREQKDGEVSFNELQAWITQRALERLNYVTEAELRSKDKDGDSALTFGEYQPQLSDKDIEKKDMRHGEAGWWMERFNLADTDQNGLVNFTELRDLLHPEDSQNKDILKWMLRDRLQRMDHETDGKLNFNEFEDHVYNTYGSYADFETNGGNVPDAEDKFAELDVNKDQFLSHEELIPILPYLYPGEIAYAKYFTHYLMNEADDNRDGKLSLKEMLNHEFIFYNTVHADGHEESDDEHDEL